ncbi:hypothetical protein [Parvularcula marina]|uniref:hypothetical protein n=1 Tax=Parvularcula marina TaxID=2292771 RepID=UPI0035135F03
MTDKASDTSSEYSPADSDAADVSDEIAEEAADEADNPNEFTLDDEFLASRGFFAAADKPHRVALEMRGVKRRLLRRLGFSRRRDSDKRNGNTVLVTSTRPAEGKTFTAINLALSLVAEDGIGTVLIDADAPRPRVLHQLGIPNNRQGLMELLSKKEGVTLDDCLLNERFRPFSILPVGTPPCPQTELFAQNEAKTLLREISNRFCDRLVIVDSPPVLAMPDAVLLAPLVDEVIFVVEANATSEPAVATAIDELLEVNEKVSLILNKCLVPGEAAHYYSYEEYYSRKGG